MDEAVMADEIKDCAMRWLWKGYMPLGELVIIDGDPSMGKSNITVDIIARVTGSGVMPDGSRGAYGNALVLSPENGNTRIKARLRAAGADLSRVRVLPAHWTIPNDTELIVGYMKRDQSKLLVLDPYAHILSPSFRMNNDQQVRAAFKDLLIAAHEQDCTVILVRHLKKGADCPVLYRGEGTVGLIAMARAGYIVGQDPDDLSRRLMAVTKLNDGSEPDTMAFFNKAKFDAGIKDTAPHVSWDGTSPCTKDQLILSAKGEMNVNRNNKAVRFLLDMLADGPRKSREVLDLAAEKGMSPPTLSKARTELGVVRGKQDNVWMMWLPGKESFNEVKAPGTKSLKRKVKPVARAEAVHPAHVDEAPPRRVRPVVVPGKKRLATNKRSGAVAGVSDSNAGEHPRTGLRRAAAKAGSQRTEPGPDSRGVADTGERRGAANRAIRTDGGGKQAQKPEKRLNRQDLSPRTKKLTKRPQERSEGHHIPQSEANALFNAVERARVKAGVPKGRFTPAGRIPGEHLFGRRYVEDEPQK